MSEAWTVFKGIISTIFHWCITYPYFGILVLIFIIWLIYKIIVRLSQ